MAKKWIEIGVVGVDSGQIMICDPCYIDGMWKVSPFKDERIYEDKSGKRFQFGKDFANFEDKVNGKTPNSLIASKEWKHIKNKEIDEFSYNGCCTREKRHKQINYPLGHEGLAVVSSSGYGDGCYPVMARLKEGRIAEIKIKFM